MAQALAGRVHGPADDRTFSPHAPNVRGLVEIGCGEISAWRPLDAGLARNTGATIEQRQVPGI